MGHVDDMELFSDLPTRLCKAAPSSYRFDRIIVTETQWNGVCIDAEAVDFVAKFCRQWVS